MPNDLKPVEKMNMHLNLRRDLAAMGFEGKDVSPVIEAWAVTKYGSYARVVIKSRRKLLTRAETHSTPDDVKAFVASLKGKLRDGKGEK